MSVDLEKSISPEIQPTAPESLNRRQEILDASLECFLDHGYQRTTIAQIRAKSGASTGSIYHLFSGKPAIAHALVTQAIDDWQANTKPGSIKKSVKSSVAGLLARGSNNWALFQFMDEMRILANNDPDLFALKQTFQHGQQAAKKQYRAAAKRGLVQDIPWPLAHALMLGPTYDYLRNQGPSANPKKVNAAKNHLSKAAWRAVKSLPATTKN